MKGIEALNLQELLPRGTRVLCAVSGGADSMCLLHLLRQKREALGIEVIAAHYEHGLRGEESLRDCAFVERWCRDNGIPCVSEHGNVRHAAEVSRQGIEETARELRYAFLNRAADEAHCTLIATAHHREDNAETILFHLLRGSGAAGLSGIAPVSGRLVRPLLDVSRREIEAYLHAHGISYVEDSTNALDDCSRNRLRHRVLPLLREENPEADRAIVRSARLCARDEDCLSTLAREFVQDHYDPESRTLPLDGLRKLHPAVASRVIRQLCPQALNAEHVDAVLALAEKSGRAFADVPGMRICVEQGRMIFGAEEHTDGSVPLPDRPVTVGEPLAIPEAGWIVETKICDFHEDVHELFNIYYFKCGEIYGSLSVTGRRPGDRIRLHGRGCTKTLKSLCLEAGLTHEEREQLPVVRDAQGVLAVPGFGRSERAYPHEGDTVIRMAFIKRI